MPELPEVETIGRGLNKFIISRKVSDVEAFNPGSFQGAPGDVRQFLIGSSVQGVHRRAKVLLIDLSTNYTLVIHLKMTGQLVFIKQPDDDSLQAAEIDKLQASSLGQESSAVLAGFTTVPSKSQSSPEIRFGGGHPTDSLVSSLPDRSTRVVISFSDGSHLYFNDQRKFGWIRLVPTPEVPNIDFMKKVGPEPLEADFTARQFAERFARRPGTSIKAALLDQSVVAGVGNIYADESLWGAKIHPARKVRDIKPRELADLYRELRTVLNLSIEKGGSTDRNYVDAEGKKGSYLDFARVFRRESLPCPRCGTIIIKFKCAGRGTHICPHCQKL